MQKIFLFFVSALVLLASLSEAARASRTAPSVPLGKPANYRPPTYVYVEVMNALPQDVVVFSSSQNGAIKCQKLSLGQSALVANVTACDWNITVYNSTQGCTKYPPR
jgi:hypothetical protein